MWSHGIRVFFLGAPKFTWRAGCQRCPGRTTARRPHALFIHGSRASKTERVVFVTAPCGEFLEVRKSVWRGTSTTPGLSDLGAQRVADAHMHGPPRRLPRCIRPVSRCRGTTWSSDREAGVRKAILAVASESPAQSRACNHRTSSTPPRATCRPPDYVSPTRVWYIRSCMISAGHGGRLTGHTSSLLG